MRTITKIKITNCTAGGTIFSNLTPDSIHLVIPIPEKYKDSPRLGVWVMGVGEPVKVLPHEYEVIEQI